MCAPAALRVYSDQPGAGLHGAHRRGFPPAAPHTGLSPTPGDSGTERKQADQSDSEGADRRPEGQKVRYQCFHTVLLLFYILRSLRC